MPTGRSAVERSVPPWLHGYHTLCSIAVKLYSHVLDAISLYGPLEALFAELSGEA